MQRISAPAGAFLDLDALTGRTFDGVLFDMDGTLIDSMRSSVAAWRTWADEHDVDPAALGALGGLPAVRVVAELVPEARRTSALARIHELEVAAAGEGIAVLPGVVEAFGALPANRVAIVTSCTGPLLGARLTASGLRPPREVVCVDDVANGKPSPDPFLLAAHRIGVDPHRCLVVEDAPAGLAAGRAAGCATLAVGDTHHHSELEADGYAPDLGHVRFSSSPAGITVALA
ncbi:HAD-IA family hydrolase [Klenkia soli]|uniref:HAD-IA family hydrolase n=1 Tax=Klenkia soli TaxID=1052260 RepID=UPI001F60E95D|nr:HAD-IA family hydrolase [Klenkia soli]